MRQHLTAPLSRRCLALTALALAGLAFASSVLEVKDPDTFHHLALGRHVVQTGLEPEEPFLYPQRAQKVGPPPYWLGSVAIYGWHAAFGDSGLAFLPAAAGAILVLLLVAASSPADGRHTLLTLAGAALPLALAMAAFRFRATARPELFAILFLIATLWIVKRFEEGRRRLFLTFPLLAALWTNIHPSTAAGLGVVGLLLTVGIAERAAHGARGLPGPGIPSGRDIGLAAALGALGALASLATPSPMNPVALAFRFVASTIGIETLSLPDDDAVGRALPFLRHLVTEMARPDLSDLRRPAGVLFVVTGLSFALRWRCTRWREVATFAAFVLLASRTQRFLDFFAIASAPFAARNFGEGLGQLVRRAGPRLAGSTAALGACAALAVVPYAAAEPSLRLGTGFARGAYPVHEADYLEAAGFEGTLFNTFHFGGYLEWRGVGPPFQDGRGLTPRGHEAASILGPVSREAFAALDAAYHFDALLLAHPAPTPGHPPVTPGSDLVVETKNWALVAFDDAGLLFLRRGGKYSALAERDEYRWARPSYLRYYWPRHLLPELLAEYRRSVSEAPSCGICRFFLASAALASGLPQEAALVAAPALSGGGPELAGTLRVAARAAEALGNISEAERLWSLVLETGEEVEQARLQLARLALGRGDPASARRILGPALRAESPSLEALDLALRASSALGDTVESQALHARREAAQLEATAEALHQQGLSAHLRGDHQSAIALLQKSLSIHGASAATHSNLGYAYLATGRLLDAEREQRHALALDSSFSAAHYGLGMVLESRGETIGAMAAYRRYIELEPNGYWALRAGQRLQALQQGR